MILGISSRKQMASIQSLNFVPTSIAGCQLWLDATDASTLILSGVNVNQWNDKSGNSRNAVFSLSNFATRSSSNSGVSFSNSYYTTTYTADPTNETLFIAFRSFSPSNTIILSSPNANGRFVGIPPPLVTPIYSIGFGKDGVTWGATTPITSNANVFTTVQFSSGAFSRISANGGAAATYTALTFNSGSNTNIGGALSAGSLIIPYIGIIYEIIAYNSVLSPNNTQTVEGYLAWKWGLVGNLPATHPFKLIAPNSAGLVYPSALTVPVPLQSFAPTAVSIALFNPTSITGLSLWLDAVNPNNSSVIPSSGSTLSTWSDRSGNVNNGTGATATYQTNVLNGLPAITFNGNTSYTLAKPAILSVGQTQGSTLFALFRITTNTGDQGIFVQSSATPGCDKAGRILYWSASNNTILGTLFCGFALTENTYIQNQVAFVSDVYTNTGTGNYTHDSFLNGTAFTTTGATITGMNTSAFTARVGTLNLPSTFLTGNIFEILYYNRTLTAAQRQQVEGYLAWKWGLVANLSVSHPYKNAIPGLTTNLPVPLVSFQPASFRPTQISGCSVWLDAADLASVVISGTSVTQWNDKSGNSRNFTSVANPNYIANARNGQGVVRFSNSYLQSPSVALFSSASSGGSFFFVFQTTNNSGQSFLLTYQNQTSGVFCQTETEIGIDTGAGTGVGNFGLHRGCGYATIAAASTIANTTFYIMEVILSTSGTTPTNVSIFQNGTSLSVSNDSLGYYSAGSYPNANNTRSFILGGRASIGATPDSFFTGDMAEVIWYSGPVSVVQRQQVEGYLAWKWGLVGNLPTTHPFKKFPPPPV
jgi:hypothetical protein